MLALIAALGLLAAGCSGQKAVPQPEPSSKPPAAVAVVFLSGGQLVLGDTEGKVRKTGVRVKVDTLNWSPDGRYVAWLDQESNGLAPEIHLLEVASGQEISLPCPCRGVAYLGDQLVTLSADGGSLIFFTSTLLAKSVRLTTPLGTSAVVVVGGRDKVIATVEVPEAESDFRGQSRMFGIDTRGKVVSVLKKRLFASFASAVADPAGTRFASVDSPSSGACWFYQTVSQYQHSGVATGIDESLPNDSAFRGANYRDQRVIRSTTWATNGLVVTFAPASCAVSYPSRYVTYLRQGRSWTYLGAGWLAAAYGAEGRSYRIEAPTFTVEDGGTHPPTGSLVLLDSQNRKVVLGQGIKDFWLTPAEAAGGSVTPPPTEKRPAVPATSDTGQPLPKPAYDLALRIASALDRGAVDELTALCKACTPDRRQSLRTASGRAEMRRALTAHAAVDGKSINFPGLAESPCVDDPDARQVCTAEQLQDAGILNLPEDSPGGDDSGHAYSMVGDIRVNLQLNADGTASWIER